MISYDKKTRHLIVSSGEAVTFDIQLRGRINVVRGAAATGKTYMCTLIRNENHHTDVVVFERGVNSVRDLTSLSDKLIIIDRADMLSAEVVEHISQNLDNTYLIMARVPLGLGITPNYIGEFVRDNRLITMRYNFSVPGWF